LDVGACGIVTSIDGAGLVWVDPQALVSEVGLTHRMGTLTE
ncbi:hypothetical protein KIPB_014484, partial [Kipferlia bialata]